MKMKTLRVIVIFFVLGYLKPEPFTENSSFTYSPNPILGNFKRCVNQECVFIKKVARISTPCTQAKNEKAVWFFFQDSIDVGVLNSDGTITDSQCPFDDLKMIDNFAKDAKKELGLKLKYFVDDIVDVIYLSLIGLGVSAFSFLKYLQCSGKACINPFFKQMDKPIKSKKVSFSMPETVPQQPFYQVPHSAQYMSQIPLYSVNQPVQYSAPLLDSEVLKISNSPFLRQSDQYHFPPSAPAKEPTNAPVNEQRNLRSKSMVNVSRPSDEQIYTAIKKGCRCSKGTCITTVCSCKLNKQACHSGCHPGSEICQNN